MNLSVNRAGYFGHPLELPAFAWEPAVEQAFALDAAGWKRAFGNDVAPARALVPALLELYARATGARASVSLTSGAVWLSALQETRGAAAIGDLVALALNPDLACSRACVSTVAGMTRWNPEEFDAFVGGFLRLAADAGGIASPAINSSEAKQ